MSFFLALLGEFVRDRLSRYGLPSASRPGGLSYVREGQALALRHGEMLTSVARDRPSRYGLPSASRPGGLSYVREGQALALRHG